MKIKGNDYEPVSAGPHKAVICSVIDLGTQDTPYGEKQQLLIEFEIVDEQNDRGENRLLSRFFTKSLHVQSALRPFVEDLVGRGLTRDELAEGFDMDQLAGLGCIINVRHEEKETGIRAKVHSVHLPGGEAESINGRVPLLKVDLKSARKRDLDDLAEWQQNLIQKSKEYEGIPA